MAIIRTVSEADFPQINKLLEPEDWDDGDHILRICLQHTNCIWQVAVNEKGEVVGTNCAQKFFLGEKEALFRVHNSIRDDYQGMRLATRFRQPYLHLPSIGNASMDGVRRLSRWFSGFGMKLVGYAGMPNMGCLKNSSDADSFKISILEDRSDMDKLLAYDRHVFDVERTRFMREWSTNSGANEPCCRTIIATSKSPDQKVLGFGTLRLFKRAYDIQPVYADHQSIALAILRELVRLYAAERSEKPIRFHFDASNAVMMRFVHELGLKFNYCETKSYTKGREGYDISKELDKSIRYDRVYCMQYYWPV